MGMLRSTIYQDGVVVNGVTLGEPVIVNVQGQPYAPGDDIASLRFGWDDARLPNGEIVGGVVVPDEAGE